MSLTAAATREKRSRTSRARRSVGLPRPSRSDHRLGDGLRPLTEPPALPAVVVASTAADWQYGDLLDHYYCRRCRSGSCYYGTGGETAGSFLRRRECRAMTPPPLPQLFHLPGGLALLRSPSPFSLRASPPPRPPSRPAAAPRRPRRAVLPREDRLANTLGDDGGGGGGDRRARLPDEGRRGGSRAPAASGSAPAPGTLCPRAGQAGRGDRKRDETPTVKEIEGRMAGARTHGPFSAGKLYGETTLRHPSRNLSR